MYHPVEVVRVELDRIDRGHDPVLLHIGAEIQIHPELKELPEHADRHGEAERHDRQIDRREPEGEPVAPVEHVDERESDRRDQKAVQRM